MNRLFLIFSIGFLLGCNASTNSKDSFDKEFEERFKEELEQLEAMENSEEWRKVTVNGGELQCPCCDYFTIGKRGEYDICLVCFWEDDGVDVDNLDGFSGPNHITLREGRANFLKFGACDSSMVKNVVDETERNKFKYQKRVLK